ncbi:MAG: DUF2059 domain-containing protein [Pseudomonadota bacterium]
MRWLALCLFFVPQLAAAQGAADLSQALRLPELARILSTEAVRTGGDIDAEMLGGEGGPVFAKQIEAINDPARLSEEVATMLAGALSEADQRAILAFTQSPQGQRAIELELAARQAFLDPEVEAFARAQVDSGPHAAAIDRLIAAGDMVGQNQETAVLTTEGFYRGLREGGAVDMSDAEITDLAQEQAAGGEADTRDWLAAFFTLAYSPLPAEEMEVLVAFWETDVGLRFSDALYDAFDAAYGSRWFSMGQAAALFLSAEDI